MKYIMLSILLSISGKTLSKEMTSDGIEYTCSPKKTCEEQLALANKEIRRLKAVIAKKDTSTPAILEKVVEKQVKVVKKHIVSVTVSRQLSHLDAKTATNSASVEANTKYLPNLTYQYQFNSGLVPQIGISATKSVILGVGIEF